MMRIIEGLPSDTLGVSASGTVTSREFQDILRTAIERAPTNTRLLFIAGPGLKGFADKSPWEDLFATDVSACAFLRIAVVTGLPWLRAAVTMMRPLLSGDLAIFAPADLPAALQWLADGDGARHHRGFIESEILGPSFKDIGQIVDAEDLRHDNGIVRKERKLHKSALKLAREERPEAYDV